MKTFIYENQIYIRCIPAKSLFHSSLVHEVVNRGDIFAVRVSDKVLTIVPGRSQVDHTEHPLTTYVKPTSTADKTPTTSSPSKAEARAHLKRLADEIRSKQLSLLGNL